MITFTVVSTEYFFYSHRLNEFKAYSFKSVLTLPAVFFVLQALQGTVFICSNVDSLNQALSDDVSVNLLVSFIPL